MTVTTTFEISFYSAERRNIGMTDIEAALSDFASVQEQSLDAFRSQFSTRPGEQNGISYLSFIKTSAEVEMYYIHFLNDTVFQREHISFY